MPKEHKKRGRRAEEKKRKHEDHHEDEVEAKRPRVSAEHVDMAEGEQLYNQEGQAYPNPDDAKYFGMLDEDEQEYFKRADDMLEANQFQDEDDRSNFLASVYKEAEGKELKMACSQGCSRLMERLIQTSTTGQLKTLFQKFSSNFLHLVQHRFASHCCESLFIQAAPCVTTELRSGPQREDSDDPSDVLVSMEDLFLSAIRELDEYLGFLMTDRFASHTLRVLLVVLSGQALAATGGTHSGSLLRSKKKEHVYAGSEKKPDFSLEARAVPAGFTQAMENIITKSVAGLDTSSLRALATSQTGNPTLQLLISLELSTFGKSKAKDENSIMYKLLPDDPISDINDSGKWLSALAYDTVGSRLLETIIKDCPGKMFKPIYRQLFKSRLEKLARNDTASYVVSEILKRLGKDDLKEAMELLCFNMTILVEHNRTALIKTLIQRCVYREIETSRIAQTLEAAYSGPRGFEITKLLRTQDLPLENVKGTKDQAADKLHGSLLAQEMVKVPGALSNLIFDSFARLTPQLSLAIARDPTSSHALQASLKGENSSVIFRRKMIQHFYGHVAEMALDPAASHVIDAVWTGTNGLAFIRERIAEELAEAEASLRESHVGRAVWRNWKMDLYKRRRRDWVVESRQEAGSDGFMSFPEVEKLELGDDGKVASKVKVGGHMSAIEKARIKFAQKKEKENAAKGKERVASAVAV
ncbi:Conidial pigment polyketide synthase [Venturia inaequalis]|nr:Conidial pigment polyketide synthase [Venturia inaequalis]